MTGNTSGAHISLLLPILALLSLLESTLAQSNIPHCIEYNNTLCTQCDTFYYVANDGKECDQCSLPCLNCTISASNCTACIPTYFLTENTCSKCSTFCLECTSATSCSVCIPGYYLKNNQCLGCPKGCAECDSTGLCELCKPGYTLSNGECSKCLANCVLCNSTTTCEFCELNYTKIISPNKPDLCILGGEPVNAPFYIILGLVILPLVITAAGLTFIILRFKSLSRAQQNDGRYSTSEKSVGSNKWTNIGTDDT